VRLSTSVNPLRRLAFFGRSAASRDGTSERSISIVCNRKVLSGNCQTEPASVSVTERRFAVVRASPSQMCGNKKNLGALLERQADSSPYALRAEDAFGSVASVKLPA
jgi:hypothetical protein